MRPIAHRGNLHGPDPHENRPDYLLRTLEQGYDVECDVWMQDGRFYLGHDRPQYMTDVALLANHRVWCHAKSPEALYWLITGGCHAFFHEGDACALTSKGYIWQWPEQEQTGLSVLIFNDSKPELWDSKVFGVCSNWAGEL